MAELVGGAALGAVVSELLKVVIDAGKKCASFEEDLKRLELTLVSITPHLEDITHLEKQLKESRTGIDDLITLVRGGKDLVLKCTQVGSSNYLKKVRYSSRLHDLDNNLKRYLNTVLQLVQTKDIKKLRVDQLDQSKDVQTILVLFNELHRQLNPEKLTGESSQDRVLPIETTNSSCISPRVNQPIEDTTANSMGNNIILDPDFAQQDLSNWAFNSCSGNIVGGTSTLQGGFYAHVTNRRADWEGLEQDITSRFKWNTHYHLSAYVRASKSDQEIKATLRLVYPNSKPRLFRTVGSIYFTSGQNWQELTGDVILDPNPRPIKVVLKFEGPEANVDLLVKSVSLTSSPST